MIDPINGLTWTTLFAAKSAATNNATSTGLDMKGYHGRLAVRTEVGIMTAGDAASSVRVLLQSSADNTAANAVNVTSTVPYHDSTTNNTANASTVTIDPRAERRYLHIRNVITGANSPAFPLSVSVAGIKQVQP